MKANCLPIVIFSVFLVRPVLADEPVPNAKVLGITEAIVGYCSKVDPSSAEQYQGRIKMVSNGASEEKLARLRQSEEYQKAHASVDEFVAKVDEHNSRKVCMESLPRNK